MASIEKIVKFNAQTAGREKLIRWVLVNKLKSWREGKLLQLTLNPPVQHEHRLCQYATKFVNSILHIYYTNYSKGGIKLLELLYKLRELEQYFVSCRRLMSFGRCADQFYSAVRSLQFTDPIVRMTTATSKFWLSFQMFADHVLWLNQMGILKNIDKQPWLERANKFWLYSVCVNLMRDFYELICVVQRRRSRDKDNLDSELRNFKLSTPIKWIRRNPRLSCDLIKNSCDFWIPYTAVNKIKFHSSVIAVLGIISTTMGILQVYDREYRLSPS